MMGALRKLIVGDRPCPSAEKEIEAEDVLRKRREIIEETKKVQDVAKDALSRAGARTQIVRLAIHDLLKHYDHSESGDASPNQKTD